ncbi:FG-GAP-like repeat-containing protein [Kitasatospora sp. NPDC056273]|uniref:FG-GAP-like repeat-containing protein n=1 Tax=Kitasatospora sp. NPDC056273 TaxID=3345769 RepID=UPI0035D8621E
MTLPHARALLRTGSFLLSLVLLLAALIRPAHGAAAEPEAGYRDRLATVISNLRQGLHGTPHDYTVTVGGTTTEVRNVELTGTGIALLDITPLGPEGVGGVQLIVREANSYVIGFHIDSRYFYLRKDGGAIETDGPGTGSQRVDLGYEGRYQDLRKLEDPDYTVAESDIDRAVQALAFAKPAGGKEPYGTLRGPLGVLVVAVAESARNRVVEKGVLDALADPSGKGPFPVRDYKDLILEWGKMGKAIDAGATYRVMGPNGKQLVMNTDFLRRMLAMKRPCKVASQLSVRAGSVCSDDSAAIVSMGDSYISGEGGRWAGNGDATGSGSSLGTDRAATDCSEDVAGAEACRYDLTKVYGDTSYQGGNGCDRSDTAEIKGADLYGVPPGNRFNIACSGAETKHVRGEGFKGEAPQVQQLRELAKQQDVKVIALSVGGNDLDFSGILTRCARRFMLGQGACHDGEDGPLKSKLAGLQGSVEGTVDDIRAAMRDAGYEDGDYTLVIQSYPSPFPQPLGMRETGDTYDRYTKAGFPFYDEDAAWTNRTVTPAISDALKKAAVAKKAVFLDPRSAFAGHELNSKDARTAGVENSPQSPLAADAAEWVRWVDHLPGVPSTRKQGEAQEFVHPNAFGQQALSECLSQTVRQHDAHPQYGTFACDGRAGAAPGAVTVRHTGLESRDPWDVPKLTVMPLGDSITQGVGSANDSLGYRKELWQALKDHTGSLDFVGSLKHGDGGFDGDHEGHSGWRIDELTDNAGYREGDLDTWLPAAKPNVITLMAGTNDLNRGAPTTPQDARDRMDTLLGKIHAMAPDATVVLGSVPPTDPATPWVRFQPLFDAYNKLLPPLVDTWRGKGMKVRFADMGAVTAGDMRGGDGLHPTPSGYTKIADAFYEGVAAAAADGWITENVAVKPAPYSGGVLGDGPVDIDGDGKADYLVVGDDGSVEAWLNRGTDAKGGGGWQSVGRIAAGVAPGGKVRFADLDGDGKADYLVLNDDGSVQAWLNRGTDMPGGTGAPGGGGGMDPSTGSGGTTGTGTPGGGGGMDPSGGSGGTTGTPAGGGWQAIGTVAAGVAPGGKVRFADVNGDGKADYLVVEDDGSVSAWLNTDGRGGWNGVGRIAAGVATGDKVRFADFDGDGKADYLVVGDDGSVNVWLNKGTDMPGGGGWSALGKVAAGVAPGGKVRFADVDGDKRADYVVVGDNGSLDAWLNNGGDTGERGWTELGQVATGVGLPSKYVWLGDIDGDKKVDYLASKGGGVFDQCMLFNRGGDGRGGWEEPVPKESSCDRGPDELPDSTSYFTDFDGDGKADHLEVMPDGRVMCWAGTGKGGFRSGGTVAAGVAPAAKVRLADFDGDGKADYLVLEDDGSVSVWLNKGGDGYGGWEAIGRVAAGVAPSGKVRFADVNGDRRADYLVVEDDGSVKAWINNGGDGHGGWRELGQIAAGVAPRDNVRFADFDGDGRDDYLVLADDGAMRVWLNHGGDAPGWIEAGRIAAGVAPANRVRI